MTQKYFVFAERKRSRLREPSNVLLDTIVLICILLYSISITLVAFSIYLVLP